MRGYPIFIPIALLLLLLSCSLNRESDGYILNGKSESYRIDYKSFVKAPSVNALKLGFVGKPGSLNPYRSESEAELFLKRALYSSLFYFDTTKGKIEKNLVLDYSISEDGLSYNFILKPDLKFSNGDPLTSADIIASLELYNKKITYSSLLRNRSLRLTRVKDSQFLIHLKSPDSNLLYFLTDYPIIKAEKADEIKSIDDFINKLNIRTREIIGSGPYRLSSYSGKEAILERNLNYFKSDEDENRLPYTDTIKVHFYDSYENLVIGFVNGDIHTLKASKDDYTNLYHYFSRSGEKDLRYIEGGYSREKIVTLFNTFSPDSKPYLLNDEVRAEVGTLLNQLPTPGYEVSNSLIEIKRFKKGSSALQQDPKAPLYFKVIIPENGVMSPIKGELEEILKSSGMLFKLEELPYNKFIESLISKRDYDIALFNYNFDFHPVSYTRFFEDRERFFYPYFSTNESNKTLEEQLTQLIEGPLEEHTGYLSRIDNLFQSNFQLTPAIWLKEYFIVKDDIYNFKLNNSLYRGYDLNTIERVIKLRED